MAFLGPLLLGVSGCRIFLSTQAAGQLLSGSTPSAGMQACGGVVAQYPVVISAGFVHCVPGVDLFFGLHVPWQRRIVPVFSSLNGSIDASAIQRCDVRCHRYTTVCVREWLC